MTLWYVGDPCYIIPDDQWGEFCEATFNEENQQNGNRHKGGHIDSVIDWHGQEITLWSNGGDGAWEFSGLNTANGEQYFGVDAGIFCVINLDLLPAYKGDPARMGILFDREPDLYVENDIVYINDKHDTSVMECEGWRCGRIITLDERVWCKNGNCDEGCDWCFECSCCDDCGESGDECSCGEEE